MSKLMGLILGNPPAITPFLCKEFSGITQVNLRTKKKDKLIIDYNE